MLSNILYFQQIDEKRIIGESSRRKLNQLILEFLQENPGYKISFEK